VLNIAMDEAVAGLYSLDPVVPALQVAGDLAAPQMLPSMQLPDASTCGRQVHMRWCCSLGAG
jgi:hypothetical protein